VSNQDLLIKYNEHVAQYGVQMATREEYEFRFELFMKREAEIAESNANPDHTFTLGHNFMSTMTDFEV